MAGQFAQASQLSSWQRLTIVVLGYVLTVGGNFYVVMKIQHDMDLAQERGEGVLGLTILASLWPSVAGAFNSVVAPILNHLEDHEVGHAS